MDWRARDGISNFGFMKMAFLTACVLAAFAFSASAEESSRTWTDEQGRTLEGILRAKSETHAEVALDNGRVVMLPIAKLSLGDQDHIAAAAVPALNAHGLRQRAPEVFARTVSSGKSSASGYKRTLTGRYDWKPGQPGSRSIEVDVSGVVSKSYTVVVVWLADGGNKSRYGIRQASKQKVDADEKLRFDVVFPSTQNYRGFAVGLLDENNAWVSKSASQKPFERFLDEWLAKN